MEELLVSCLSVCVCVGGGGGGEVHSKGHVCYALDVILNIS